MQPSAGGRVLCVENSLPHIFYFSFLFCEHEKVFFCAFSASLFHVFCYQHVDIHSWGIFSPNISLSLSRSPPSFRPDAAVRKSLPLEGRVPAP